MMVKSDDVILSITAHPDDEVLGFGATASMLASKGVHIYNCILSGDAEARRYRPDVKELYEHTLAAQQIMGCKEPILGSFPNISFNTVPHVDLVRFIESAIEKVKPDYIFTHHPSDLNNDHYHVSLSCQAASRLFQRKPGKRIKGLFYMEILSSTDWSFKSGSNNFQPNAYFEIGEKHLQNKIEALKAYKGVMRDFPHPRSEEVIKGLAACRGAESGMFYAEAFQSVFQSISYEI